ncbi:FERM domain-containing protein 3-like [Anoplophora glabripennis]|uniref:FERM domain-containing protein 3-like n=1 Tax=Anoplophora glabripennis TaxID=217634 RepID=UPI000874C35F|nr:FERM domain-containing protein 3-like [Anoplophora glabripennis]
MKTVLSKTGIEVLYPCTIHLLRNGEILECEYKSDHTGRELLNYICDYQGLSEKEYWGLKYVDTFEQRHWLELDKLIRSQVKNVCPIHFHFRVKVYPPEPYKLTDKETKHQIFLQLRYDLVSGRLCCGPNDSALLLALILQYTHGDFNPEIHIGNYIKDKIILNQNFMVETKAIEIHRNHLSDLKKSHIEDLFLRMACQLEAYGIDPYLVEAHNHSNLNLWVNHNGMVTYVENRKVHHLKWMDIAKVEQDDCKLIVKMGNDEVVEFVCLTKAECNYIYRNVVDHLIHFTATDKKSTASLVGSEFADMFDEAEEEAAKIIETITNNEGSFGEGTSSQGADGVTEINVPKSSIE